MLTSWLANKTTPSLQESIQDPGEGHQVCSWSCAYSPCVYCSLSCFRSNMMVWFLVWTLFHIFSTSFTLHFISRFYCAVFQLKLPDPTSFFFILFWTWTMFLFFFLCSLLHRHKTACQIRSRSRADGTNLCHLSHVRPYPGTLRTPTLLFMVGVFY